MAGLRERRHLQTRDDLVEAAFALFAKHGYSHVTMEQIATAAGVSRSTAYRRFPTKEDVVLEVPTRWLEAFDDAANELPDDATLAEAFAVTALAVSTHIDANRDRVRAAFKVLEEAPSLATAGVATTAWLGRMVGLVDRFGDHNGEEGAILAGAYLGGIDAMMMRWAMAGGTGSVVSSTKRLIKQLQPLLD